MPAMISVGMGEGHFGQGEGTVLVALGLGSCVAVCLYDPLTHIAAMAHAMLPVPSGTASGQVFRFAESAVPALLAEITAKGAITGRLRAALVGGAQMFRGAEVAAIMDIGSRNVLAAHKALTAIRLPLMAEDVGGSSGRSVYFDCGSGIIRVRTIGQAEREITALGNKASVPLRISLTGSVK